jgi:hypothetical protein
VSVPKKFDKLAAEWLRVDMPAQLAQIDTRMAKAITSDGAAVYYDIDKAVNALVWVASGWGSSAIEACRNEPWFRLSAAVSKKFPIGELSPAWKCVLLIFRRDVPASAINAIALAVPPHTSWRGVVIPAMRRVVRDIGLERKDYSQVDALSYEHFRASKILRKFILDGGMFRELDRA